MNRSVIGAVVALGVGILPTGVQAAHRVVVVTGCAAANGATDRAFDADLFASRLRVEDAEAVEPVDTIYVRCEVTGLVVAAGPNTERFPWPLPRVDRERALAVAVAEWARRPAHVPPSTASAPVPLPAVSPPPPPAVPDRQAAHDAAPQRRYTLFLGGTAALWSGPWFAAGAEGGGAWHQDGVVAWGLISVARATRDFSAGTVAGTEVRLVGGAGVPWGPFEIGPELGIGYGYLRGRATTPEVVARGGGGLVGTFGARASFRTPPAPLRLRIDASTAIGVASMRATAGADLGPTIGGARLALFIGVER